MSLSGNNVFELNKGGAMSLIQSRVDVSGVVYFTENAATAGGALALQDQCLVLKI